MDFFVLDTLGDGDLLEKAEAVGETKGVLDGTTKSGIAEEDSDEESENEDEDFGGLPPPSHDISHILKKDSPSCTNGDTKKSRKESNIDDFMKLMGWKAEMPQPKEKKRQRRNMMDDPKEIEALTRSDMRKQTENSVLNGIEKRHSIEKLSERKLADRRKEERSKTKGKGWFDMPATEITEEVENDLKVLQMRSALDPKHFYKKNDLKILPKYFQIGTVQHSPLDYYNERDIRKNKKRTIVDELMADADFQRYNKRKFKEVIEKRRKTGYHKANLKMKKLKKRK